MNTFNFTKYAESLKSLRGSKSQESFSKELGVNRSTLSLLETGKQYPTIEQLNFVCTNLKVTTNYFFDEYEEEDKLVLLMGKMTDEDKSEFIKILERHHIKSTYRVLRNV